jgi:hypothetical protein
MNQEQINHVSMYDSVVTNLNLNAAIYSLNSVFSTSVTNFKNAVTGLSSLQIGQINHSSGITVSKEQAKTNLIALTIDHAEAGRAYASVSGNVALKQNLKVSASGLNKLQDAQLAPACQDIYNQISPIIGGLNGYGVNATTLLSMQGGIGTFMPLVGQPKNARSTAKAFTNAIAQQIQNIQIILDEQLDPLMRQYKITHQTFHDSYLLDRKIGGKRTTVTIKGMITNAQNQPIKKAHVKLLSTTRKVKITKADGKYQFARMHPGSFTIEVSAKGYATQSKTVTQSMPRNVTINVSLSVSSNTGGGTTTNTTGSGQ